MKRRVCSYDMLAVPDPSFVLKDSGGEMHFLNLRCFCVWSVGLAIRGRVLGNIETENSHKTHLGELVSAPEVCCRGAIEGVRDLCAYHET
jgi:hypothetical protein